MPSETIYLPDDIRQYVQDVEQANEYDNTSQAIQHIVMEHIDEVNGGWDVE